MVAGLGEVCWIVDLNRQSLDRVVPNIGATRLQAMFAAAGWQVLTVKYGRLLQHLFGRPGGELLRERIDSMPNPEYQRLLRCAAGELRGRLAGLGYRSTELREMLDGIDDETLHDAVRNLGGHDLAALGDALATIQDTRPTVIFAYTIKGHGLASEGHPQNHSSLLTKLQLDQLAQRSGMSVDAPWARFPDGSQVTLAAEGRAHQSITTASVGLEQPGCVTYEPAFALDVEWTLLASMARLGHPDGCSAYLRLSTRPVDQSLAAVPTDPAARERRRAQVVAGAYVLHRSAEPPAVTIAALGALIPEAMAAVERLAALDVAVDVVCLTSPHLLFSAMQSRDGRAQGSSWILDTVFPVRRAAPMVTVLDGHPHTLAFLAASTRSGLVTSASPRFGQSGDLADVYRYHHMDTDGIVAAAIDLL